MAKNHVMGSKIGLDGRVAPRAVSKSFRTSTRCKGTESVTINSQPI